MSNQVLPESRLYTFLDPNQLFSFHLLEGQKLYHDLVLSAKQGAGHLAFFRELVLSSTQFLQYLKHGEQLGFYIDSVEPKFLFKLECHSQGTLRCLLMPTDLASVPDRISGQMRLMKFLPGGKSPYQSILNIDQQNFAEITNQVLKISYQIDAHIEVSQETDQSLMLAALPKPKTRHEDSPQKSKGPQEFFIQHKKDILQFFKSNIVQEQDIIKYFEQLGLEYIQSKEVKFFCPCSEQNMIKNLASLANVEDDPLFTTDKPELEIICDYCQTEYRITQDQVDHFKSSK
jgi:molecular chaperone Hsp33